MEVILDKQYPVAASVEAAWAVLSNLNELTTCMPGAQITETIDATHYTGAVRVKVGPAVAAFAGTIEVQILDAATHTLKMLGKGADKSGSSASMALTAKLVPAEGGHCTLEGHSEVIVNGKFAQFGGRMMTSVSDMILGQFAVTFSQKAEVVQASMVPVAVSAPGVHADVHAAPAVETKAPVAPVVAKEFNALGLVWALVRNFFAGLFGRKA
jgi:carbon monoxide dehydrogenase subunit G